MRSPVKGGNILWEKAQVAWEMRQSLPEFEARDQEEQDWLLAVWRTKAKISTIESVAQWRKQQR